MPLDKGSLMPPHHCWHAEMGEGRLNRKSFLRVQGAAKGSARLQRDSMHTNVGREKFARCLI